MSDLNIKMHNDCILIIMHFVVAPLDSIFIIQNIQTYFTCLSFLSLPHAFPSAT